MKRVAVLAPAFLGPRGEPPVQGGAERHLSELCRLLEERGWEVTVFQAAACDFRVVHDGRVVCGLAPTVVQGGAWPVTNRRFREAARSFDHHLFHLWSMAYPEAPPGSIGVSHSLWWDDGGVVRRPYPNFTPRLRQALQALSVVVANDTNVINWVRATWPELEERFRFIPNFVDLAQFSPEPARTGAASARAGDGSAPAVGESPLAGGGSIRAAGGAFRVLVPCRLEPQKGLEPMLQAALLLTEEPGIEVHFVGSGPVEAVRRLQEASARRPAIRYRSRPMAEMPAEYRAADLVVIPSLASEGTSLSCLEAMASGRPVIAGWVGGLSNLIIHEYNGLLLRPTAEGLAAAVRRLWQDAGTRARMAERALEVARVHALERWRQAWGEVLDACWGG